MTFDPIIIPDGVLSVPFLLGYIAGALLIAFFGIRLLKLTVMAAAGYAGFILGMNYIGPFLIEYIGDYSLPIGIICAVVLAILAIGFFRFALKLMACIPCAGVGFLVPYILIPNQDVGLIVGIVLAVIASAFLTKWVLKCFKLVLIIETSVMGGYFAACAFVMLLPVATTFVVPLIITIAIAASAFGVQYKMNKHHEIF